MKWHLLDPTSVACLRALAVAVEGPQIPGLMLPHLQSLSHQKPQCVLLIHWTLEQSLKADQNPARPTSLQQIITIASFKQAVCNYTTNPCKLQWLFIQVAQTAFKSTSNKTKKQQNIQPVSYQIMIQVTDINTCKQHHPFLMKLSDDCRILQTLLYISYHSKTSSDACNRPHDSGSILTSVARGSGWGMVGPSPGTCT